MALIFCTLVLEVEENVMQILSAFLMSFGNTEKKRFACTFSYLSGLTSPSHS